MFAVDRYPSAVMRIISLMLAASGFVWIIAEFAWHRWGTAGALGLVGTVTAIVFGVDQLLGAPLSFSGIFSYSPIAAFRFYGIGNEGAAILVGAAIVGVSLELDGMPVLAAKRRLVIIGTGVLAVALCALPFFGANVVVAVWGTLTFGALYLAAEQRRPRPVQLVALGAIVLAVVAAAVLLDRMVGGGTHIGRAVSDASTGGIGGLIASRAATSLRILHQFAASVDRACDRRCACLRACSPARGGRESALRVPHVRGSGHRRSHRRSRWRARRGFGRGRACAHPDVPGRRARYADA